MIIFKNFITTLKRFKASSLLNIAGLAIAFASFYIIMVQVNWDLTFNKNIRHSENICMIQVKSRMDESKFSPFLCRPLTEKYISNDPKIVAGGLWIGYWNEDVMVKRGNDVISFSIKVAKCTPSITKVFDFKTFAGDVSKLSEPKSVLISKSVSTLLGCTTGDMIFFRGMNPESAMKIVAVYEDFPKNSYMGDNGIIYNMGDENLNDYSNWNYVCFVRLANGTDPVQCENGWRENLKRVLTEMNSDSDNGKMSDDEIQKEMDRYITRFSKITDTYFQTDLSGIGDIGNKTTTYSLFAIAIFIVLIAMINFINFFFALVPVRIRAVNTFKIFGSSSAQLRCNFVFEAFGLLIIGLIIASFLVYIFSGTSMASFVSQSLAPSNNVFVFIVTILTGFFVAVAGSLYPAYYITSFSPAMVIKGSFGTSVKGRSLRTILISIQFIVSFVLVISTMFVKLQHNFMMNYDMGFNKENLLVTSLPYSIASLDKREAFTSKLLQNPQIKALSFASGPIVAENRMGWGRPFKNGQFISFQCYPVSFDFLSFMGIKIEEGRNFSKSDELDSASCFIFNEQARKEFGLALGDKIIAFTKEAPVVGFCSDFKFKPLNFGVSPFAFVVASVGTWTPANYMYIRTAAGSNIKDVIDYIASTCMQFENSLNRDNISIKFFDEELGKNYENEQRLAKLITMFSLLSIVIALIGVFGLVLFDCQFRRKEIAVRKVHGATIGEVLMLFNKRYVEVVAICFIVSVPLSWYIMERWLAAFAYRINLYWWVFIVAFAIVLVITIMTVSIRSIKAAMENPALSVKE